MKNKSKTIKILTSAAILLAVAPVAVLLTNNTFNSVNITQSEDNLYTLQLDRETNPAPIKSLGSTAFDVKTSLGNAIELNCARFEYLRAYDFWALLYDEGYVFNTTPISGITSITVDFYNDHGGLTLQYGNKDYAEHEQLLYNNSPYIIDTYTTQFKLISDGLTEINSITITYTC